MSGIRRSIVDLLSDDHPMTCRQVFYRLVSQGVIGKTEGEYQQTVIRLLVQMRRSGEIPYRWIADNTRWQRKPTTHSGLFEALDRTAEYYRRALWDYQDAYVEVWLEKEALAGVLFPITSKWDVPLMVTRGYPSLSFLHSAAETIGDKGKPTFLYYLGDHDPSGVDIPRCVENGIREIATEADLTFERIAVTPAQIESMGLQTRPTKKTDSRSKHFKGESVEVDAIPPADLKRIVESCITRHVDMDEYRKLQETQRLEKDTLREIARTYDPLRDDGRFAEDLDD
jgi:hypothetical protein